MEPETINNVTDLNPQVDLNKKVSGKILNKKIIGGVVAIVLVIGSALGAFYFTKNLNQASVPNAPSSEPQAAKKAPVKSWNGGDACKQGCGKNEYCEDGRCRKSGGTADVRDEYEKLIGLGTLPVNPTNPPAYNASTYVCTATNCPAPCFSCNSSKTSCISNGCPGVSSVGKPGESVATIAQPKTPTDMTLCQKIVDAGCPLADCHCIGGDACPDVECGNNGVTDLRTSCANQGRSWCVNMGGKGMTCCAAGYTCHPSGKGCTGSPVNNNENDTEVVVTINPTVTSTSTITATATTTVTATATITSTITATATTTVSPTDEVTPTDEITTEPTISSCNEKCNEDSDCSSWLVCDTESDRCRRPSCLGESDCKCTTARKTVTGTRAPTQAEQVVERLPDTGIFDLPETTIFGGGLLLAIIGLFLAL